MIDIFDKPLFIFELANNHQGQVEHGLRIIRAIQAVCRDFDFNFAFKFQYRDLDSYIHPDYMDRSDVKNVKRFKETRLDPDQFKILKAELNKQGFFSICTPFDEKSVDNIDSQGFDVIKIASCSVGDWSLLERIAESGKPVIASTAGSTLEDIKQLVSFFSNRDIDISLMHCVAEYSTTIEHLQLNQIDLLKKHFPNVRIGYSTHEDPNNFDGIKIAVAKGAGIFEKHVGIPTEAIELNAYSATPEQIKQWLYSAQQAFAMCGIINERYHPSDKEIFDLAALKRGAFAKHKIGQGARLDSSNTFLAFPSLNGQLLANDFSKYNEFYVQTDFILPNQPIMSGDISKIDKRPVVEYIVGKVLELVNKSNVVIPVNSKCELSHHYDLSHFETHGAAIVNCINREYCKKIIVLLSGQHHPNHYHRIKEETFLVVYGDFILELDDKSKVLGPGESFTIERGIKHSFSSINGAVIEEISTTHYNDDSFYDDTKITDNQYRKTEVYITKELLQK